MKRIAISVLVVPLTAACLTGRAQTPAQQPALDVPPPPPRIVEPVAAEPVATVEPVPDLPPAPLPSRPRSQPPRDSAKDVKPDPKPETPPAPEAPPPTNPPPANATPQIRTPGDTTEAARQVRDVLDRASKTLSSIDYGPLSQQRKESYDTAKRFILQAEDAIKASNFVYARFLADKADTLAKELQGR